MEINQLRSEVRKIEADIIEMQQLPAIPKVLAEIRALYERKWALEREACRIGLVVPIGGSSAK